LALSTTGAMASRLREMMGPTTASTPLRAISLRVAWLATAGSVLSSS